MKRAEIIERLKTRTAARWALCVSAAVLMLMIALPIGWGLREQSNRIDVALRHLSRLRAEAAQIPALRARLSEAEEQAASLPGALQAKTAVLGQSRLQQSLEALLSANGATVRSAQVLQPTEEQGFDILGIQYDLAVPMSKLGDLGYVIETRQPYLFLTDISISGGGQIEASSQSQDPQLEVRWTVRAYRWGST